MQTSPFDTMTGCYCTKYGAEFNRKGLETFGTTKVMTFSVKHEHRARVCHNIWEMGKGLRADDGRSS